MSLRRLAYFKKIPASSWYYFFTAKVARAKIIAQVKKVKVLIFVCC